MGPLPKLESRSLKYGYSNARVKAMKGQLLKQAFLEELIKVHSIEGMAELLQRTGYKGDLAAASAEYSGSRLIENAAARNFAWTVRKLMKIAPGSDKEALKALLLRWDLMNVKALLTGRRLKKGYEDVKPLLFDVGGLDEEDFRRILRADELELARRIRKTELGRMLPPRLGQGAELESALDTNLYAALDRTLASGGKEAGAIRRILKKEIDAKNIMIIERLKKHGVGAPRIRSSLIKGGTIGEQMISKMIEARDIAALMNIARSKFPRLECKGESMSDLEIAFEKAIAAEKVHAFGNAILSAGVMFGFLLLKEEEINNLRKIAKGKEFRMGEAEVRAMLVM